MSKKTSETKELLPCAHCGGKALCETKHLHNRHGALLWAVRCVECASKTAGYIDKDDAIAAWNRRATPQWTKELPTEEGLYAVLLGACGGLMTVHVFEGDGEEFDPGLWVNHSGFPTNEMLPIFAKDYQVTGWLKIEPPQREEGKK